MLNYFGWFLVVLGGWKKIKKIDLNKKKSDWNQINLIYLFIYFFFFFFLFFFFLIKKNGISFKIKKVQRKTCKNVYLGFIFIPGKYVLQDVFWRSFYKDDIQLRGPLKCVNKKNSEKGSFCNRTRKARNAFSMFRGLKCHFQEKGVVLSKFAQIL